MNYSTLKTKKELNTKEILSKIPKVKISYSITIPPKERITISSSAEAYSVFKSFWDMDTIEHIESAKLILLNRVNHVLGVVDLALGGTVGCVLDIKVIFQYVISSNSCSFIISHNHPSGNLKASNQDLSITKRIIDAAKTLDVQLLDHIILTNYGYTSLADEGLI